MVTLTNEQRSALNNFLSSLTVEQRRTLTKIYLAGTNIEPVFSDKVKYTGLKEFGPGGRFLKTTFTGGNLVFYDKEDVSSTTPLSDVDQGVVQIGDAMHKTPMGRIRWKFWEDHPMVIRLRRGKPPEGALGDTPLPTGTDFLITGGDDFGEHPSVKYGIYSFKQKFGVILEGGRKINRFGFTGGVFSVEPFVVTIGDTETWVEEKNDKYSRFHNCSEEEFLNAVGVHETWHLDPYQALTDVLIDWPEYHAVTAYNKPINSELNTRLEYRTLASPSLPLDILKWYTHPKDRKFSVSFKDEFLNVFGVSVDALQAQMDSTHQLPDTTIDQSLYLLPATRSFRAKYDTYNPTDPIAETLLFTYPGTQPYYGLKDYKVSDWKSFPEYEEDGIPRVYAEPLPGITHP